MIFGCEKGGQTNARDSTVSVHAVIHACCTICDYLSSSIIKVEQGFWPQHLEVVLTQGPSTVCIAGPAIETEFRLTGSFPSRSTLLYSQRSWFHGNTELRSSD